MSASTESSSLDIAVEVTEALIQQLRANPRLTARLEELNIGDTRVRLDSNTSYKGGESNIELKGAIEKVVEIVLRTGIPLTYSHSVTTSGFESGRTSTVATSELESDRTSTATLQPDTEDVVAPLEDKDQELLEKLGASARTSRRRGGTRQRQVCDVDDTNT